MDRKPLLKGNVVYGLEGGEEESQWAAPVEGAAGAKAARHLVCQRAGAEWLRAEQQEVRSSWTGTWKKTTRASYALQWLHLPSAWVGGHWRAWAGDHRDHFNCISLASAWRIDEAVQKQEKRKILIEMFVTSCFLESLPNSSPYLQNYLSPLQYARCCLIFFFFNVDLVMSCPCLNPIFRSQCLLTN